MPNGPKRLRQDGDSPPELVRLRRIEPVPQSPLPFASPFAVPDFQSRLPQPQRSQLHTPPVGVRLFQRQLGAQPDQSAKTSRQLPMQLVRNQLQALHILHISHGISHDNSPSPHHVTMEHELTRAIPTSPSHRSDHPDETRQNQSSALYPILKLLWPSLSPLFSRPQLQNIYPPATCL
ncbi:hypothetical protein NITLEN_80048 [Nitrospira lenta]|uniref:Uncharacterized protein n=1 Tax=Nitrospira lenta TaxID=1436998 RepID=A0A330LBG0_9BACT|nr:hypothetical protein NITLEN_80048 [Nitrospira lenta]